jgi:excisionase family DNA binding protein
MLALRPVFFGEIWYSLAQQVARVWTMTKDEILTISEVKALLKIGEKTTYTMTQSGQLPEFKVRVQWRFRRTDIDQWIAREVGRAAKPAKSEDQGRKP